MTDLRIETVENGRIVVVDGAGGHRFAFHLATARGAQVLDAYAPVWAGGAEPPDAHRLVLKARERAEQEARDRGLIADGDPDVG